MEMSGKDLLGTLLKGWNIGVSTVKTVAVVERLTKALDDGNVLENIGEVARRLQHYDDLTMLTHQVSHLVTMVDRLITSPKKETAISEGEMHISRQIDALRADVQFGALNIQAIEKLVRQIQVDSAKEQIVAEQPDSDQLVEQGKRQSRLIHELVSYIGPASTMAIMSWSDNDTGRRPLAILLVPDFTDLGSDDWKTTFLGRAPSRTYWRE